MNDLFQIAPSLLPIHIATKDESNIGISYKGFINLKGEDYYLEINSDPLNIKINCEARLNSILFDLKDILAQRFQKCNKIPEFIFELKNLIEQKFQNDNEDDSFFDSNLFFFNNLKFYKRITSEISEIGWKNLKHANDSFTELVFQYAENDRIHELKINLSQNYPKKEPIYKTELPIEFEFTWTENSTLRSVLEKFIDDVTSYSTFWDEMKQIDEYCWILEPIVVTKCDTRRRINLIDNVSIQINVDPKNPKELPEIIFFGPEIAVDKYKQSYQNKFNEWNSGFNLLFNLEELLDIRFPKPSQSLDMSQVIECGICYAYELNNTGPTVFCEEKNCNKAFHEACLYEWLKTMSTSKVLFGFIYGECTYCSQSIKCRIFSN